MLKLGRLHDALINLVGGEIGAEILDLETGKDVGIGDGFQKGQTERQHIQGDEKCVKARYVGGGDADEGTDRIELKTNNDARTIGVAADVEGGRYGHGPIATIESHLDPAALRIVDDKNVVKRRNKRIRDVIGKAPEGEQNRDKHEGKQEFPWNCWSGGSIRHGT